MTRYALTSPKCREYLFLGKVTANKERPFEGPKYFAFDDFYLLPDELYSLLVERYCKKCDYHISYQTLEELSDLAEYREEDHYGPEIGGERDFDISLKEYLPELNDLKVIEQIKNAGLKSIE
ncbi:MAG: hypothetical protein ACKVOR_11180 [Flavobacteriales bacterium]